MILAALSRPWMRPTVTVSGGGDPGEQVGVYSGLNLDTYPIYRIDMSDDAYSKNATQGASITHEATGAWDAGPCAKMFPPNTGDGGYISVCQANNLNQDGALEIRQLGLRFELQFGSTFGAGQQNQNDNKFIIVHAGATNEAVSTHRPIFNLWKEGGTLFAPAVAAGTLKQFNPSPPPDEIFPSSGASDFYFGDAGTTGGAGTRPIITAGTWLTYEIFMSAVPIAGFADGCIRLRITGRDGTVHTTLSIPWNYDSWSAVDYFNEIQVIGGYYNLNAGSSNADNFQRIAGVTYAANQSDFLGPRSGFLT
jgi:hypothetical protein